MASRPPPRFVVRPHDAVSQRRAWIWVGAAWVVSLILVALIVGLSVRSTTPAASEQRQLRTLAEQNDNLRQQVANLQRAAQVSDIAAQSLRNTLGEREEEVSGLRADLGFYARLVGSDAQREGPRIQDVRLRPIPGTRGFDLSLSVTQNAKRGEETSGKIMISVEGLRGDKVVQLDGASLGDASQKDGLPFRFKYFQQLHATIVLPPDVKPNRLRVDIQPNGDPTVSRTLAWSDALDGTNAKPQGESDAQP